MPFKIFKPYYLKKLFAGWDTSWKLLLPGIPIGLLLYFNKRSGRRAPPYHQPLHSPRHSVPRDQISRPVPLAPCHAPLHALLCALPCAFLCTLLAAPLSSRLTRRRCPRLHLVNNSIAFPVLIIAPLAIFYLILVGTDESIANATEQVRLAAVPAPPGRCPEEAGAFAMPPRLEHLACRHG